MAKASSKTEGMLTISEVSQLLNVHSNTLRRWSDQGIIRVYRIGPRGDRRYWSDDIAGLLLKENHNRCAATARYRAN
jgi:excisionase family DNA binding protein